MGIIADWREQRRKSEPKTVQNKLFNLGNEQEKKSREWTELQGQARQYQIIFQKYNCNLRRKKEWD